VYRERARRVEEEMERMGEERDREVRCMMDAMAERGMLVCLSSNRGHLCSEMKPE
jgi:hypothetical protein